MKSSISNMNKCPKIVKKWRTVKLKTNEILNTQERAILLDVCGRRQLQVCHNPDLLWGVPVVASSKAQEEEMDRDSLVEGKCL